MADSDKVAGKHAQRRVASIHSSFNIFRNIHDAQEGDVTIAEQIKALERFVRWHQRQLQVGTILLARLVAEAAQPQPEPAAAGAPAPLADVATA